MRDVRRIGGIAGPDVRINVRIADQMTYTEEVEVHGSTLTPEFSGPPEAGPLDRIDRDCTQ